MTSLIQVNYGTDFGAIGRVVGSSNSSSHSSNQLESIQFTVASNSSPISITSSETLIPFTRIMPHTGSLASHTRPPSTATAYDTYRGPMIMETGIYLVSAKVRVTTSGDTSSTVSMVIGRAKAGSNSDDGDSSRKLAYTGLINASGDISATTVVRVEELDTNMATADTFYVTMKTSQSGVTAVISSAALCEEAHILTITKLCDL